MTDAFWPYAKRMLRYRWLVLPALVFAALSAGGMGAGLAALKPVFENVMTKEPKRLADFAADFNTHLPKWAPHISQGIIDSLPKGDFDTVFWIVIGVGVLTIFGATCNFLHAYLSLTVISRTVANIRREAFHGVVHLPLKTVLRAGPSDLVSRIVYDTANLGQGFNALLSKSIAQLTKGLVMVGFAFYFNWKLTLAALVAAPIVGFIIRKLGKRIRRASRGALQSQAGLYQSASEVLGGLRVVKVYTTERTEEGRFHRTNKDVVAREFKVRTARALASPLVETVTIFVLGGLALVAVKAILDKRLDPTDAISVLACLGVAGASLKPLTGFMNDIQQASAAAVRLRELMGMEPEPGHDAKLPKMARHAKSIEFDGVSLTYPGAERPAINGISMTIDHGRTIAFVGPNGCGKTTLLSLIPRLFDPDAGRVVIDGQDIRGFGIRSLRGQIGVVTQETVLFRGSIRDNIAYGSSGVTEEKLREAARRARAEEFILQKPEGYNFIVGEGGSGLSGGQRQRIAIARAILRDPAILILDEATSMIDSESEHKIAEAIAEFVTASRGVSAPGSSGGTAKPGMNGTHVATRNGRTCLIVAHRLSTVIDADSIVVMDQGRIVDTGTHGELLGRCAIYQSLVANQMIATPAPSHAPDIEQKKTA
jgi:ABC-type multidrug transport system fused ATPase/permease subunit